MTIGWLCYCHFRVLKFSSCLKFLASTATKIRPMRGYWTNHIVLAQKYCILLRITQLSQSLFTWDFERTRCSCYWVSWLMTFGIHTCYWMFILKDLSEEGFKNPPSADFAIHHQVSCSESFCRMACLLKNDALMPFCCFLFRRLLSLSSYL